MEEVAQHSSDTPEAVVNSLQWQREEILVSGLFLILMLKPGHCFVMHKVTACFERGFHRMRYT